MIKVTVEDTATGEVRTRELPADNYLLVACRWSEAVEVVSDHLGDGALRGWKARELADQAVEALAFKAPYLLAVASKEHPS